MALFLKYQNLAQSISHQFDNLPLNNLGIEQGNFEKGRMMRIELTNAGATIRCVNHFATFAILITNSLTEQ